MKKVLKSFFSIFIFMIMVSCLGVFADDDTPIAPNSDSKSVVSLNVSVNKNSLIVNGEAQEGMLAVAIAIYDKSGKNLVTMQTTAVNDDNNYETSVEVENGTYLVKVADYQGGSYLTKLVTVGNSDKKPSKDKDSGKTEDAIIKDNDKSAESKDENNKNKTVYFPKTGDNIGYVLLLSGLGIISVSLCFAFIKKRKIY